MLTNRIDLKSYKTGLNLRMVISFFNLKNHFGTTLTKRGPCPFCCKERPGKKCFAVDLEKGGWYCHGCLRNGDALTLWAGLAEVSVWQAAKDLSSWMGTAVPWLSDSSDPVVSNPSRRSATVQQHSCENNNFADNPPKVKPTPEELLGTGFPPPLSSN